MNKGNKACSSDLIIARLLVRQVTLAWGKKTHKMVKYSHTFTSSSWVDQKLSDIKDIAIAIQSNIRNITDTFSQKASGAICISVVSHHCSAPLHCTSSTQLRFIMGFQMVRVVLDSSNEGSPDVKMSWCRIQELVVVGVWGVIASRKRLKWNIILV